MYLHIISLNKRKIAFLLHCTLALPSQNVFLKGGSDSISFWMGVVVQILIYSVVKPWQPLTV